MTQDINALRILADLAERVYEREKADLAEARRAADIAAAEARAFARTRASEEAALGGDDASADDGAGAGPAAPADAKTLAAASRWRDWADRNEAQLTERARGLDAAASDRHGRTAEAFARTRAIDIMTDRARLEARRESRRRAERDGAPEE